jgi:hypothetical protein
MSKKNCHKKYILKSSRISGENNQRKCDVILYKQFSNIQE